MKRIFRLWILAVVAMIAGMSVSGCVSLTNTKIPEKIGFKPVIGHDTRTVVEESVPFPQDRSFKVWAKDMSNGEFVLDDETVTYGADGWLLSQTWPDAELSFTAYSPVDLMPDYSHGSSIVLRGFNTYTDKRDILVASVSSRSKDSGLVPLHFEHILSRVDFRLMHSLDENIEIIVKKIELVGFSQSGDYNTSGDGLWKVAAKTDSYVVYDAGDSEGYGLTRNPVFVGDDFFTIPQLCEAKVVVSYLVRSGSGNWIPEELAIDALNTNWQSGKQYTYTLNMTGARLVYTTGISNWNNRE